jgi:hypothetical protein
MSPSSERPPRVLWRSLALDAESELGPWARLCACAIAEFANDKTRMCDPCPSAMTLARRMGCSERKAQKARLELERAGLLRLERRVGVPARALLTFPTSAPRTGVTPARRAEVGDSEPLHNVQETSVPTSAPCAPEPENQKTDNQAENEFQRRPPPREVRDWLGSIGVGRSMDGRRR